jgi:TPP-dependent pyruvate/acetoin dehydrogenase alpha subunit
MDVLAVAEAAASAVAAVRESSRPYLLEFRTYRFRAHSMYDPERYRSKAEVEEWRKRGPIETFPGRLQQQGLLSDTELSRMEEEVAAEIEAAVAFADAGTWERVEDLTRFVTSEVKRS